MKKIGELSIKPEKVIKNEELVNLRGGTKESECAENGLFAFQCRCSPPDVGLWRGCYADQATADASLTEWCASGNGECDQLFGI